MSRANLVGSILGEQTVHGVLIAELDHPDGVVRVHTGTANIIIAGVEYAGAGGLLNVDGITDDTLGGGPHTWTMSLSRATPALAPYAVDDSLRDRGVRLAASVSEDGVAWTSPVNVKIGRVSSVVIKAEGIALECATATMDLARIRQRHIRWTEAEQRGHVNTHDRFFRYMDDIADLEVSWP